MSQFSSDSITFEVLCPNCSKKIVKTLGWFKNTKACPFCGVGFEADEFKRAIEDRQKIVDDATREMAEALKKIYFKL